MKNNIAKIENVPGLLGGVKSTLKTLNVPLVLSLDETSHSGQGTMDSNEKGYLNIYIPNNFNISLVSNTLTLDCFLNAGSSDQIGALLSANDKAKYGSSFVSAGCGDILLASERNLEYFDLGNVSISLFNKENKYVNSHSSIPTDFITFSLFLNNSSKTKSGEIISQSLFNNSSIKYLLAESDLKNENNIVASITNNSGTTIFGQSPCLLATSCFNSSASLSACSSVNLLLDKISSAIENSNLLTNCLTTLANANSNLSFNSAGTSILIVSSAILTSQNKNQKEYLNLSEFLPLIGKNFFLIKYIEQWGTGTNRIIEECLKHGLPEPEFEDTGTSFVITIKKSVLTDEYLKKLDINERQKRAIEHLKEHKKITNKEYCELFGVVKDTANRDLNDLLNRGLIEKRGSGPKIHYVLATVRYSPIPSDDLEKSDKNKQNEAQKEDANSREQEDCPKTELLGQEHRQEKLKEVIIQLSDNSVFSVEDKDRLSALNMKLEVDSLSLEEFTSIFAKEVEKHWKNKTVPTKFPFDISWERDLKDEIWHKLYHKLYGWEEREVKKTFGYFIASLTPARWFDKEVKEKNAKLIRDGIALKDNELILRNDTKEAKTYWKIAERFSEIVKKETEKEFAKRREEAKSRFKNQAELAKEVFYHYVRPYLIGILLGRATKGKAGSIITSDDSKDSVSTVSMVKHDFMISKKFKKFNDKEGQKVDKNKQKEEKTEHV